MTHLRYVICLLFIMSLVDSRDARSQTSGRLSITETSIGQSQWRRPIISPVRCDQDRNLYIREYVPGTSNNTVTIVGSKGDKATETSFDANSSIKNGTLPD